ncbi:MAG: CRISPR-associated protein Cst1 [Thermosediminibacterales bacterium]|nr:CRISPR-associated protein Cst1 [Thermosediminibacterales bacterium]
MNKNKDVIIYPSTWYYNACVQGFLEILAWGLGDDVVESFFHDNVVSIPKEVMEALFSTRDVNMPEGYPLCSNDREVPDKVKDLKRIVWWWVEKSYEMGFIRKEDRNKKIDLELKPLTVMGNLFHFSNGFYPNIINPSYSKKKKVEILNHWFTRNLLAENQLNCSFCGEKFVLDFENNFYESFFTRSVSQNLGNSPDKVPNYFWDGNPNLPMCQQCRSYFLCFHIIDQKKYFINSDSLKVNWYLNRLVWNETKSKNSYQKALLAAVPYNSQFRSSLGSWGLQSMEVISFERGKVNYYPISDRLAELFLIPTISSLLGKLNHDTVWDVILKEKFNYLLTIIYKSIYAGLTGENRSKDPEVVTIRNNKNTGRIDDLIDLFYEIKEYFQKKKGGGPVSGINLRHIREAAKQSPFSLDDNSKKNLVYRLLELTRLNKKSDVYHLLVRAYVANGNTFPSSLARLFEISDAELFKTGIYAYISGLDRHEKDN